MKADILQEKLASAFALTNRVASTKTTLPVLANTKIETEEGRLRLSSTNLEVSLECWVGGNVEGDGATTVPTALFQNYVQNIAPQKVTLDLDGNNLRVVGASSKAEFVTMSANDFPSFPSVSDTVLLTLSPVKLQSLLKKILFAAATNEGRPVLTGVLCRGTQDGLILVATDGFRLAELTVDWTVLDANPPSEPFEMIIPAKMLREIGQFSAGVSGEEGMWDMRLTEDKNQVVFTTSELRVYARLLDAAYPPYENIIPSDFTVTATFDRDALLRAVRTTAIFAHSQSHTVTLTMDADANAIILSAESNELGRQETTIPATIDGDTLTTAFNANYVLDSLSGLDSLEAQIHMRTADDPALVTPVSVSDNERNRQIIMPIRLDRSNS
ncbi:DNA polymerase III subunit beta [candidate division WWE3 bacterium]|uniref:Beta sliding clamp n=1 Tax=candidate division WWE3 bacterium TaxID=2053526 RepID=A0A955LV58_UNCKA|nr:DNA polymerase III subunit beta [candidate division WWE3 bacterium]